MSVDPLMNAFLEETFTAMLTRTVVRGVARTITAQETDIAK